MELTSPLLAGQPSHHVVSAPSLLWSLVVVLAVAFRAVVVDHLQVLIPCGKKMTDGVAMVVEVGGSKNEGRQPNFACWECQHNHVMSEFQWT